jgi:hypothetical protein
MIRRFIAVSVAAIVVAGLRPAAAQSLVHPQLTMGAESGPAGGGNALAMFAPLLGIRHGGIAADLRAVGDVGGAGLLLREASISLSGSVWHARNWTAALQASGTTTRPTAAPDRWSATRLELQVDHGGPAAGYSISAGLVSNRFPDRHLVSPTLRSGVWIRELGVTLRGAVGFQILPAGTSSQAAGTMPVDSFVHFGLDSQLVPTRSSQASSRMRLAFSTDAALSATGAVAGMDVSGVVGAYFVGGVHTRPFGNVTLTRWITSSVGVTAGASRRVLDPVAGSVVTNAVFGVKLGAAPGTERTRQPSEAVAAGVAVSRSGDSVTIAFRAPQASRAEMRGDLTGWTARSLRHASGGWWRTTMRLSAGVYRVDLRLDGRSWSAPPGVPHVADAYAGEVGVVIVP